MVWMQPNRLLQQGRHIMKATQARGSLKRKMGIAVATALCFVGLGTTPLGADAPTTVSAVDVFPDTNPCSGEPMLVTINFEGRFHEHKNVFVGHGSKTGSTSDGYVMNHGVDNFVSNNNIERGAFTDNWRNSDGSKFKAQGSFVFDLRSGELLVDNFSLRCVGKN